MIAPAGTLFLYQNDSSSSINNGSLVTVIETPDFSNYRNIKGCTAFFIHGFNYKQPIERGGFHFWFDEDALVILKRLDPIDIGDLEDDF